MGVYPLARNLLFKLEAEKAHNLAFSAARFAQLTHLPLFALKQLLEVKEPILKSEQFGLTFESPLGLAAGFDKNAEIVGLLSSIGFGFLEVGSVTNRASQGNPQPRMFRLEDDEALINRMGLNNHGPQALLENLRRHEVSLPIGINIAKSHHPDILEDKATADMLACYEQVVGAADYTVLNVSCPNTADGKTFEEAGSLRRLLEAVTEKKKQLETSTALLVKFSSDLDLAALEEATEVCEELGVDGYVMVNTSTSRLGLKTSEKRLAQIGAGGLSGKPLQTKSLEKVRAAYRILKGSKPIIGLGGIDSPEFAYLMIKSGANLLQLYSALVFHGPGLVKEINQGLVALLRADGYSNISEAVGVEA